MKTENKTGIVYLIGAGPGDPGLITVKGMELINNCDAVVFDNLVPDELIVNLPPQSEKYYVGKRAGAHTLPQSEMNELLVKLASEGKRVARLKGSDPLIFGRGGEEAKYLKTHGIEFEIVPGVTSGIAAPAYCGIPCTDRDKASLVTFVTGHKAQEKALSTVPWECIARAKNGTVVIYMGVGEIANIVRNLMQYGMSADSPMAVIERGTFPTQRSFTTNLKDMPDLVIRENIQPPALFVVGEVVKLQPFMEWFGHGPLFGIRVMVTRPADQSNDMYRTLRELGAEVLPYPTITTSEFVDDAGWRKFKEIKGKNKWLILTSENGVRYFFDQFAERIGDIRKLADYKIAAVGYGTARALRQVHLKADFIPKKATTRALADELCAFTDMSDANVIRIRGNLADDRIEKRLIEAGASMLPVTCYETSYKNWPDGFKERLFEHLPDIITFTSGSTAEGLCKILSSNEIDALTKNAEVISIGPSTTEMINSLGIKTTMEADEHSIPGVIAKIVEHFTNKIQGVK